MSNKKAVVFDTNFIIQNPKLDEVVEKLKDNYTVYITQVSIDERIAQQCRGLKQEFDEVEKCQQKYSHLAEITFSTDYEELANEYRNAILNALRKVHPPRRVFTDEECADIIIADIQNDAETLSAIYAKAEKREKARLKQIKAGLRK